MSNEGTLAAYEPSTSTKILPSLTPYFARSSASASELTLKSASTTERLRDAWGALAKRCEDFNIPDVTEKWGTVRGSSRARHAGRGAPTCELLCLDLPKAEAVRAPPARRPPRSRRWAAGAKALGDPTRLAIAVALADAGTRLRLRPGLDRRARREARLPSRARAPRRRPRDARRGRARWSCTS